MKEAGIYGVVQKHIVGLCATLLRLKKTAPARQCNSPCVGLRQWTFLALVSKKDDWTEEVLDKLPQL